VSASAGWYADPSGVSGQLRWWDGDRWTDHVTPDPSAVPASAGATGSAEVHGSETGAGLAEPTQPPPPTGTPDPAPAWGGDRGGAWGSGDAARPAWQVDAPVPTSSTGVRTGLIVAAVVGAVLLGVVALFVIGVVRTGSVTFSEDGGSVSLGEEWDEEWEGETLDGGQLSVGQSVSVQLPTDGAYEVTVDIEDAGTYVFDARGDGDFDGMLELYDPDGDLLGENDDRGEELVDRVGGDWLDPLLEFDLEPGEYRVLVRGWAGDGGAFDLVVDRS
jgi:hypothetical protein